MRAYALTEMPIRITYAAVVRNFICLFSRYRTLFDAGVLVTINTDHVRVFGQGVSEEFWNLFDAKLFDADELELIRLAGLTDPAR